ncbi:iron chelate uptake ABC transporter family permease subunit [Litoribrevibacter albus]|uniref:High-affinity zinc uptake system membrane protein ZnuB n=1 Tax=Litoribrevibacter albus TaxID=1473156 RepID=A0AA37SCN4_9GAMM|nr:iron chelate uptake ABC transporter family permease subunit [Litoribrevibacter albus]GLQ32949.1 zinc ABC transporter permease [Litoribrevibacter albus]
MPEFMILALLGGLGIALMTGPLGCFVVWRKMAYFGDTLAHSALLGIAMGLLLEINLMLAVTAGCVLLATSLVILHSRTIAMDTLLGIMSHTTLSLGLIVTALLDDVRIDLMAYLFGDLLSIELMDLYWILGLSVVIISLLVRLWQGLLSITLQPELAAAEGYRVQWLQWILMVMIAVVIALAMKIVGILLITSLLIIPPAIARVLSDTPEQMAVFATLFGMLAIGAGLAGSWYMDLPAGPAIVTSAGLMFLITHSLVRVVREQ